MNKLITRAGVAALVAPFALAAGVAPAAATDGPNDNANERATAATDRSQSNADNGKGTGEKAADDQDNGQEEADGQAGGSDGKTNNPGNSGTDIRLEGCEIISGKEISYVAFFDAEGDLITKNEAVNDETFDLSTVEFDFEEIEVKSGTTIELFDDECQTTDDANGGSDGDGTVQDENGGDDTNDNGGPSDEGNDDDRGNNNDRGDDNRGNDRGDNDRGGNDRGDRDNDRGADNRGDRDNSNRGNGEVRGEQTMNAGGAGAPAVDAEVLGVEETVAVPTEVAAGVSGAEALPQTGAEDKLVLFGAIGLGLLALGGAAMVIRRRLGSGI